MLLALKQYVGTQGPVTLAQVAAHLGYDISVVEAMVDFWRARGILCLQEKVEEERNTCFQHCGISCTKEKEKWIYYTGKGSILSK